MKTKIIWFLIGAVVGIISFISWRIYYIDRPRDFTLYFPPEMATFPSFSSLKSAHLITAGPLVILTPATQGHEVLAWVRINDSLNNYYPVITFHDLDKDGIVDEYIIGDKSLHSISLDDKDQDRSWNRLMYMPKPSSDSISVIDNNMDGEFDERMGPGTNIAVNIASNWYNLVTIENQRYILINAQEIPVEKVDGVWKIKTVK